MQASSAQKRNAGWVEGASVYDFEARGDGGWLHLWARVLVPAPSVAPGRGRSANSGEVHPHRGAKPGLKPLAITPRYLLARQHRQKTARSSDDREALRSLGQIDELRTHQP